MIDVPAILIDFEAHQKAVAMAASTIEWECFWLQRFLLFLTSEKVERVVDVDTKTLIRFQIYLSTLQNKKGKVYSPASQNHAMSAVRRYFKLLRRRGEVFFNPADGLEGVKTAQTLPRNILSVEEMVKLLDQPNTRRHSGKRDKAMMEVLYSTAVRQAELLHLDLSDLNHDEGTMLVRNGKGGKDRVVPCGVTGWSWLNRYINEARIHFADKDEQAVFLNSRGERMGKQGLFLIVKYYARRSGIKKSISPHSFRHSVATHLADAGCDIRYIQELLGHSSPAATAVYIRVAIRRLKEVHAKFHPRDRAENVA